MTPQQFIEKWQASNLKETAACQSHFNDLCRVLGQPMPSSPSIWSDRGRGSHSTPLADGRGVA